MTHATLLWSIWQDLLRRFAWAFSRRGYRRFLEWITAMAANVEEHTVTQSVLALQRPDDWNAMESFAEYGAWRADNVTRSLSGCSRARQTDLRDVLDAILYILRTGCQWRYLPSDFQPKSTVWRYFDRWRRDGTLDRIHDLLRRKVRAMEKPYHPRTSPSVDSQSVDSTSGGEQRGRDNATNVDGRKRHIVVDSMGLLLAVLVTAASVDDAAAAPALFARLDGQPMGQVVRMYADSKYHNFNLYEWVEANAAWELSIVRRPEGSEDWVSLPIRWTVERTFAWLGKCRRLSKDREKSVLSSEAFIKLSMIQLMFHRLRSSDADVEFHYCSAA